MLEGHAGELACARDAAGVARDLEASNERLASAIDAARDDDLNTFRTLTEINSEFHGRILKASGSATTVRLLDTLAMPFAYRLYIWRVPERQLINLEHHRRVADAFRTGDPARVRTLLEAHLREARDFLLTNA
jgi:DNA-binding GntR family transcriptional regulator